MENTKELLKEYLSWFWLRPENGVTTTLRSREYINTFKFRRGKTLDVSCGDGVFSFIASGGKLHPGCDMFQSLDLSQKRRGDFDVFDFVDDGLKLNITKKPDYFYDNGIDWKENLITKASHLNFYSKLDVHNNNDTLPFDDESFDYVYSNSSYWVENFEKHINDLMRITACGGHVVLQVKTDEIKNYSSNKYALSFIGDKACGILDAGRLSTWKGLRSLSNLDDIFYGIENFEVVTRKPIYGDLIIYMWDIGLRPLFSPLAKLQEHCPAESRAEIKEEWCNILFELTEHMVSNYEPNENTAVEWIYVLRKQNSLR